MSRTDAFDKLPVAYQSLDAEGRFLCVNARWLETLGYRREDVIGRPFVDLLADDGERAAFRQRFPRFCASGQVQGVDFRLRRADGTTLLVEYEGRLERDDDGGPLRTHCVFRDVTERRRAAEAEQSVHDAERALLDAVPGFAALFDRDHRFLTANVPALQVLGAPLAEVVGRDAREFFPPEVAAARHRHAETVFRRHSTVRFEDEYGGVKMEHVLSPLVGEDGEVRRVAVFTRNVTEERATQGALQSILRAAPLGIGLIRDHVIAWTNPALERLLGYAPGELDGRPSRVLFDDDAEYERVVRLKYPAIERTGVGALETRMRGKDGRVVDVLLSSAAIDRKDPAAGIVGTVVDVSELRRSRTELALHNRIATAFLTTADDETYGAVLDLVRDAMRSPFGLFGHVDDDALVVPTLTRDVWDRCAVRGKSYTFPREAWAGVWGRALLERRPVWQNGDLRMPEGHLPLRCALAAPLVHDDVVVGEIVVADKPGGYDGEDARLLESVAARVAPIVKARIDARRHAAERDQLEAQVRHAQKMEAIGQLAGGVAHDFNNLLQAIAGNAELALQDLPPDGLATECVQEIEEAAERAAALTRQLLAFSRREALERRAVAPGDVVQGVLKLLRRVIGKHVDVVVRAAPALGALHADPAQLEQVLVNLCINARDAMPDGGRLTIALDREDVTDDADRPLARPGPYLRLSVSDTGIGIPPEHLERIFEPFFTTKEVGEGTGLGLATVYGIVEQHDGWVEVESEVGAGTTFHVYLPFATDRIDQPDRSATSAPPEGGSETILLAEDEDLSRRVVRRILERSGYRLLVARDGAEALGIVERHAASIDGAVLDVVMPGASGRAVAEALRARNPSAPVLFSTGYSARVIDRTEARRMGGDIVQKPCSATDILSRLRDLLDRARTELN